jgi:ComF family protein
LYFETIVRVSITPLLNFVLPSRCASCDKPGADLCDQCAAENVVKLFEFQIQGIPGFAATKYTPLISKVLVAFKEKGQFALSKTLAALFSEAILLLPKFESPVYLVPAPSSPENFARRGFQPALLLATKIAKNHPEFRVMNSLVFSRKVRDQVGLSGSQRLANLDSSMKLNQSVTGRVCYLVDDVVTTGATATQAARVLLLGGAQVVGILTLSH